jgi:hypothetical protein
MFKDLKNTSLKRLWRQPRAKKGRSLWGNRKGKRQRILGVK